MRKRPCTLSNIPRVLFNIRVRSEGGDGSAAEPSTPSEDTTEVDQEIREAIQEVQRLIYDKEMELSEVMTSLVASAMELFARTSVKDLPNTRSER